MSRTTEFLRRAKRTLSLLGHFAYDGWRYFKYASVSGCAASREQLRGSLMAQYHALEKGLSLAAPRPAFGRYHIEEIGRLLCRWRELTLPEGLLEYRAAKSALNAYRSYHDGAGLKLPADIRAILDDHAPPDSTAGDLGGCRSRQREELARWRRFDFGDFVSTRHSIRCFAEGRVATSDIEAAIRSAQMSPSVCNRQTSRVYVIQKPELKLAALECQNGNRGFREQIDTVLIVTAKLSDFCDPKERNQGFVDGGMFAMTLLLALHAQGLGACPLNWSATVKQDKSLRQAIPVEQDENVIMMIAVGHLPEVVSAARSTRLPLERVATFL